MTLKALIDAGYSFRVCPSHDWQAVRIIAENGFSEEERLKLNPLEFLYIKHEVIPGLRKMGVDEATLNTLCVDAPRNFFEGV
jgi:predicted metal-dependent phosphotriesterase family hydrolase